MNARRLRLLGEPAVRQEGYVRPLGRKDAALLAFLALEGATTRSRAAGLLWPEADETSARANLRQLLRRLRQRHGDDLELGADPLRLPSGIRSDVSELKIAAFQGRSQAVLALTGRLLDPFDYDDSPELEDWLLGERETLAAMRRAAYLDTIERLEREGALAAALRACEGRIAEDPVSESAYAAAMRVQARLGDRGAALSVFGRLQAVLRRELGVDPSPETAALAERIREGRADLAAPRAPAPRPMPPSLLRPPLLAGRDVDLARLSSAVGLGLTAVLSGPPGIGKSRLAEEAADRLGPVLRLEGLAQDAGLPFGTLERGLARMLSAPTATGLPAAALSDLAALLPGLRDGRRWDGRTGDVTRFRQALATVLGELMRQGHVLLADDLHAFDASSFETLLAAAELVRSAPGPSAPWRAIACLRSGELDPERRAALDGAVAAGHARWQELAPLGPEDVRELVRALALPDLTGTALRPFAERLHRHTGGNALFIVECLKELAAGSGDSGARLPVPQRVGHIIRQRASRLAPEARRLALAAAVLGGELDLAVLSRVLETAPLALTDELRALEAAQVIHEGAFTHDLIGEALLESAPEPVRRFLRQRAAQALEESEGEPGRIARLWLAAGEPSRALPHLLRAADRARALLAHRQAADALERAAAVLEGRGLRAEAFERYAEAYELVRHADSRSAALRIIASLERLAADAAQLARLDHARAELLATMGRGDQAEACARRGLESARKSGDAELQARLETDVATALFAREAYDEAAGAFQRCAAGARRRGDRRGLVEALANRAVALDRLDRHEEAIALHGEADALLAALGDDDGRIAVLTNLAVSLADTGRAAEALAVHARVEPLVGRLPEVGFAQLLHWANEGVCEASLDRMGRALELLTRARDAALALDYWGSSFIDLRLAEVYLRLGAHEASRRHAHRALELSSGHPEQELCAHLQLAAVLLASGAGPERELAAAERLARAGRPAHRIWLKLLQADALAAEGDAGASAALERAGAALRTAERLGLHGHAIGAHARLSRLLRATRPAAALTHARSAVDALTRLAPRCEHREAVLLGHWQALREAGDPAAPQALQGCRAWLERTTREQVPAEHREGFLRRNPSNRAIWEAARSA